MELLKLEDIADGGAWKNAATKNIKEYLEFELADYKEQFTVIL